MDPINSVAVQQTDRRERASVLMRGERKRSKIERESLMLLRLSSAPKGASEKERPDGETTVVIMLHAAIEDSAMTLTRRAIERHSACSLR